MSLQGFIYLQNILLYHQVLSVLPAISRKCVQRQGMYHDVGYLKDPILKICDFSANMYHMNMIFRFLESLLLGLSLECFLIIFGHFFEILCHFEFDVYFWAADSLPIPQK